MPFIGSRNVDHWSPARCLAKDPVRRRGLRSEKNEVRHPRPPSQQRERLETQGYVYPDPFGSSFRRRSMGKGLPPLSPDIVVSPTYSSETFGQWSCRIDMHAPVLACTTRRPLALLGSTIPPPDYFWGWPLVPHPAFTGPASPSGLRCHHGICVVSACCNMAQ